MLPVCAIRDELKEKKLQVLDGQEFEDRYGVWKLRSRAGLKADFEAAEAWLKKTEL